MTEPKSLSERRAPRAGALARPGYRRLLRATTALAMTVPALGMLPTAGASPTSAGPGADSGAIPAGGMLPRVALDPGLTPARLPDGGLDRYEVERAPFALEVDGTEVEYGVLAIPSFPGQIVELTVPTGSAERHTLRYASGELLDTRPSGWTWRVPTEPGIYALRVEGEDSSSSIRLNVIALHPAEHVSEGSLDGYRIGQYQKTPLRGDPAYLPPTGFAAVPGDAEDVLVSPHFTIGQFLCKQPGEPRFLALSMPLVVKLEAVLAKANGAGISTPTFHVMSGFRTPWYNAAIGNKTVYSRHLWGDAADIFVDVDGNHDMDDLNGDGRSDHLDARMLADLVEEVETAESGVVAGGIGLYRRASHRGPFVHVDARGSAARW